MTKVIGDVENVLGVRVDGFAQFWAPVTSVYAGVTVVPDADTVPIKAGKFTATVKPGRCRIRVVVGSADALFDVNVPDQAEIMFSTLIEGTVDYEPAVVSEVARLVDEARRITSVLGSTEQIKTWTEEADADAKAADASAKAAKASEDTAAIKADDADVSAQAAKASEDAAKASKDAAKQSEANAVDYAEVATTAATEAVDAMQRATDLAGGDFATHEYVDDGLALKADTTYVDSATWLKPELSTDSDVDSLPSGIYPIPTSTVASALGLPLGEPGELETTWLDSSGLRRRQTLHVDPYVGARPGYAMYRRWYYNGTWQPWTRYDDAWHKGRLSSSDSLSRLAQGAYEVPTGSVAKALGLPVEEMGTLTIYYLGNGMYRRAVFDIDPVGGFRQYRARYYNGTWYDWKLEIASSTPFFRGAIPAGVQPDTMIGNAWNGEWTLYSGNGSAWGIPSNASGLLYVSASGGSTLQELTTFTTPIQKYQRRAYNGAWSGPWEPMVGGGSSQPVVTATTDEYAVSTTKTALNTIIPTHVDPTNTYEVDHANLVADLKSRLGKVSTGGKAAVALVADHGTTAFKDWMWAEAKRRNIPFTMALAPEVHLDGKGDSRHTATNADIKQWISEGLVIASHSGDHLGAAGYFDVQRQIVTSKKKLEEKLQTRVDCWVQPGYSTELGSYDGFGSGSSASRYSDYYAGRMLQQTYPVITGYAGDDLVYPGDADLPVGARRSLVERKDGMQGVKDTIQGAIATGGKHINFCHPYALVDSSSTYVTKVEYIAYLDWLAQKRDAGELVLLTLPQLMVARP